MPFFGRAGELIESGALDSRGEQSHAEERTRALLSRLSLVGAPMELSGSRHVVVGAGPVGTATARILAQRGARVRIVTRSGAGPEHDLIERVRVGAGDAGALRDVAIGAAAIYNCANPPYHRWPTDWPPWRSPSCSRRKRPTRCWQPWATSIPMGRLTARSRRTFPMRPPAPRAGSGRRCGPRLGRRTRPGGCGQSSSVPRTSSDHAWRRATSATGSSPRSSPARRSAFWGRPTSRTPGPTFRTSRG